MPNARSDRTPATALPQAAETAPLQETDSPTPELIDCWVEQGRYLDAAEALQKRGELLAAQRLLERSWEYQRAAQLAAQRHDWLAQLRLSLLSQDVAQDVESIRSSLQQLQTAPPQQQQQAAELCEKHQLFAEAAQLRMLLGEVKTAASLLEQAGLHSQAAQLLLQQGQLQQAVALFQVALLGTSPLHTPLEAADTALKLGRVLCQLQRMEESIRAFQQGLAWLQPLLPTPQLVSPSAEQVAPHRLLDELQRSLIYALTTYGYPSVAHPLLIHYLARHPEEPAAQTSDEFIKRHPQTLATEQLGSASGSEPLLLHRYRILRLLGAGGMGRVYLADDIQTQRAVALKLLPVPTTETARGRTPTGSAQDLWRRFVQEAQIMQSLRHPCIVQLLDFHESAGALVMQYVGHGSLADAAQGQPLTLSQVRQVLLDVLDGLQHAHTAGVLHRDLKPQNLFVSPTGRTLIGDFGVAFLQGLGATQTESFVGTLAYMAPEQLGGQPLSVATDLYALGVTTFQLLTGLLPFAGPDFVEQHLRAPAPDPRELRPTLPTAWAELIRRALQKPMSARFASCDAMRTAVLKLPTDDLEDTSWLSRSQQKPPATLTEQQQVSQAKAQLPATATELYRTTHSRVFLSSDSQLNRPLLIERYQAGVLQSPTAASHRSWLQHFARLGGPGLQRILRIKLLGSSPASLSSPAEAEAEVHFEVPSGFAVPAAEAHGSMLSQSDVSRLRHLLTASHQQGFAHGSVSTSVVIEPTGAMLLLHGRGPLFAPPATAAASLDDDLSQLATLAGVATSSARPRP